MTVYDRIKCLLEETNSAFDATRGAMNADFAEFASMALTEFKQALERNDLTPQELQLLLRAGMSRHRSASPDTPWADFMAQHMAGAVNTNTPQARAENSRQDAQSAHG